MPAAGPHGIAVRNVAAASRYVTVVVERDGRLLLAESVSLDRGERATFPDLVAAAGTYRVAVEAVSDDSPAVRRATHDWRVEGAVSDLDVAVGDGIRVTPVVRCAPGCPPLSADGTAREFAPPNASASDLAYEAGLRIENRDAVERTVRVRVRGAERGLDYRYRVPPGTRLALPVGRRYGPLTVRVKSDGRRARGRWPAESSEFLVALGPDGIELGCGGDSATGVLVNEDDRPHDFRVRLEPHDGRPVERRYRLGAGESVRDPDLFAEQGPYTLVVETTAGARASYPWLTCPPVGPVFVVVLAGGDVRVESPVP